MTQYLQVISRLLQSFGQINETSNICDIFEPTKLIEKTSDADRADERKAPIPIDIHVFSFEDTNGHSAELELNFRKDTKELVNSRVAIFFTENIKRDEYLRKYINPFFAQGFKLAEQKKYPELPIIEYHSHGLAIGLNCYSSLPLISIYVTEEGLE